MRKLKLSEVKIGEKINGHIVEDVVGNYVFFTDGSTALLDMDVCAADWECPRCGAPNNGENKTCWNCGNP